MTSLSRCTVLAGLLLVGCGGGDHHARSPSLPLADDLCLNLDCGTLTPLLDIPDAENLLFSEDGRLFVSGGENVYEVHGSDGAYTASRLSASNCNFTGLAIRAETLYAGCFDGRLYAAPLSDVTTLSPIVELGVAAPNGMAVGPDDALYVVNGPLATNALPDPKILRVTLDPRDPLRVTEIAVWLDQGLLAPNGLQANGDQFYLTDSALPELAVVRRLQWAPDGPAAVDTVAQFAGVPDDLSLLPGTDGTALLVPDFGLGGLRLFAADGRLLDSLPPLTLRFPSQARAARPPLFSPGDILITEKGVLGDTVSPVGNRLSLFRPSPAQ